MYNNYLKKYLPVKYYNDIIETQKREHEIYKIWIINNFLNFISDKEKESFVIHSKLIYYYPDECVICYDIYTQLSTRCCHQPMCGNCILKWNEINDNCPYCRQ